MNRDQRNDLVRSEAHRALVEKAFSVGLPLLIAVLQADGLPSAMLGTLAWYASSEASGRRLELVEDALREEIRVQAARASQVSIEVDARLDRIHEKLDDYQREFEDVRARLGPAQREQIGLVVEEVVRSLDDEWLAYMRSAVRTIVRDDVPGATRRAVLAGLRMLSPEHMKALSHYGDMANWNRNYPEFGLLPPNLDPAIRAALLAAGFLEVRVSVERADDDERGLASAPGVLQRSPNPKAKHRPRVTRLGREALKMVGLAAER